MKSGNRASKGALVKSAKPMKTGAAAPRPVAKAQPAKRAEKPEPKAPSRGPKRSNTPRVPQKGKAPVPERKVAVAKPQPLQRKTYPVLHPAEVSAIVLEELSLTAHDVCNFAPEVTLLRAGRLSEAYFAVMRKAEGIAVACPYTSWVQAQAKAAVKKLSFDEDAALKAAVVEFRACEDDCSVTNAVIAEDGLSGLGVSEEIVGRMRSYIEYVVGVAPTIDDVIHYSKYGPGSSVEVRGNAVHFYAKLHSWDCHPRSVDLVAEALYRDRTAHALIGFNPEFRADNPHYKAGFIREAKRMLTEAACDYDNILFVHKNATTKRTIGAQPTQSGMLQLGVDHIMKGFLRERVGIDLQDQGLNQRLARLGSLHWESPEAFCTADLQSSSGRLAKLLVRELFPAEWVDLLFRLRSEEYQEPPEMGGERRVYQAYAGMGNGTTFCVQTLVFAAACYAVTELPTPEASRSSLTFSVYGDDIVIRKPYARRAIDLLTSLGLKVNASKTFIEGPFRESCGADFWAGVNVRPTYVKDEGAGTMTMDELVGVHNSLMDSRFVVLDEACKRLRALWKKHFPSPLPSDPQGGLGFRTKPKHGPWEIVRKPDGTPVLSPAWQRPRGYILEVTTGKDNLGDLPTRFQLAVALGHGSQDVGGQGFSLDLRNTVTVRVVQEVDLKRKDLILMLRNQLAKLAQRKLEPWWELSQGRR